MNLLGCAAAFVAMLLVYLASPHQRAMARPLGRAARWLAGVFAVLALVAWVAGETTLPGIFSALTALMFGAVVFPYLCWWLRPAGERRSR
ncbi:hypothetical protein KR767_07125 [Luteibacter anthropi]|uniref:hypothetical protein n=1 Tax=Luteibacter anthropi TaxID=564369 RepID=UPI0020327E40|nr:hypothetical protein [Luteibacter anthropi]URX63817.1 hypothetical protein KR767_07125 [Luteibacter anthropi]